MNCSTEAVQLMHIYLDGNLTEEDKRRLRSHLDQCPACQQHFHELKRTTTLIKGEHQIEAPSNFTSKVMASLPKEKKRVSYTRWFQSHPVLTAAAIFFIFMFSGIMSAWNADSQLSVSKQQNLVIENDTVIVPEGITIENDLVIKNGNLRVDGSVNGDVVLINGEHLRASAGQVNGEMQHVNQIFEWIWYHMKEITKNIFSLN